MRHDRLRSWWTLCLALAFSAGVAVPCVAGPSARVIMQFATTADRDAAFQMLLDRGAAVRLADTEAGPALVAIGSPALLRRNYNAMQVSEDAGVSVTAVKQPARGDFARQYRAAENFGVTPSRANLSVAIIDSGIQPHIDLPLSRVRRIQGFRGRCPDAGGSVRPRHARGRNRCRQRAQLGRRLRRHCATVDIVSLRVLGDDCSGNTSDVIDALEWIGRNHEPYRIRVVNLSLGHAGARVDLHRSVGTGGRTIVPQGHRRRDRGRQQGHQLGHESAGYGGAGVPCNAPSAICVGSLDTSARRNLTMIACRSRARAARRGSICLRSRISWPPASISCRWRHRAAGCSRIPRSAGRRVTGSRGISRFPVAAWRLRPWPGGRTVAAARIPASRRTR